MKPDPWNLLPSERRALVALCDGASRKKQIADRLGITLDTVNERMKVVYKKMGVHSIVNAALLFDRWQRQEAQEKAVNDLLHTIHAEVPTLQTEAIIKRIEGLRQAGVAP